MDRTVSGSALFPADPHPASDGCPPWLADRLEGLLQEMEMLNTWFTPAAAIEPPVEPHSSPLQSTSPDLYAGDAPPSYYAPRFRDLPKE